jgi:hypothetical protein
MLGRSLGSKEDNIAGTTTFKWLHGNKGTSFFLQQDMEMEYAAQRSKAVRLLAVTQRPRRSPLMYIQTWRPIHGLMSGIFEVIA